MMPGLDKMLKPQARFHPQPRRRKPNGLKSQPKRVIANERCCVRTPGTCWFGAVIDHVGNVSARSTRSKSFLVLFFKKEHFFFF